MLRRRVLLAAWTLAACCQGAFAADKAPKLVVGDLPPPYVGRELGGPDVNLDPASGKAYVISFWASWCAPCLQELPVLARIQAIAGTDKMQVIAVNIEDRDIFRRLQPNIRDAGLTATFDPGRKAREAYGVGPIPHMVIVGRDARISAIRVGYAKSSHEELAAALNQALAMPLPQASGDVKPAAAAQ